MYKEYLGDGVYIEFDGYGFVITTEDGYSTTNRIVLEPYVYEQMLEYVNKLKSTLSEEE